MARAMQRRIRRLEQTEVQRNARWIVLSGPDGADYHPFLEAQGIKPGPHDTIIYRREFFPESQDIKINSIMSK